MSVTQSRERLRGYLAPVLVAAAVGGTVVLVNQGDPGTRAPVGGQPAALQSASPETAEERAARRERDIEERERVPRANLARWRACMATKGVVGQEAPGGGFSQRVRLDDLTKAQRDEVLGAGAQEVDAATFLRKVQLLCNTEIGVSNQAPASAAPGRPY